MTSYQEGHALPRTPGDLAGRHSTLGLRSWW